jgi:hypothetical protein
MDCPTDFEEEENFFRSYEAEQARAAEFDLDSDEARPATREELAHLSRFRKPVALVMAAMGLLSIVALGIRGSRREFVALDESSAAHTPHRALVAHYGSAIPTPTPDGSATVTTGRRRWLPEPSSSFLPETVSNFFAEALSVLLPEDSSPENRAASAPSVAGAGPACEWSSPDTAFARFSPQPQLNPTHQFISALTPMCLRPGWSDPTRARQGNGEGSPRTFNSVFRLPYVRR